MIRILHLSDLHFGTERDGIVEELQKTITQLKPDIKIISGDITQRARISQYEMASQFLQDLGKEDLICVPGNHDISLYNLIERFCYPYKKYQLYINKSLIQAYLQNEIAIIGVNSVTPYKAMSGFVTDDELKNVMSFFQLLTQKTFKIVVMHHNLIKSERHKIINNAEKIISLFSRCGVNLILSGHIHDAKVELLSHASHHNMYVITAGTAISTRTTAPNSFNVIDVGVDYALLKVYEYDKNKFTLTKKMSLKR